MLGALASGLISGGLSALGGFGASSAQRKRDKANIKAMDIANHINQQRAEAMNADIRARADAAAKVPIVTERTEAAYTDTVTHHAYRDQSGINVDSFLADATRMGLNPITLVRSGALGAYGFTDYGEQRTTSNYGARSSREVVTGSHAMDAALAGQNIAYYQPNQLLGTPPANGMQIMAGAAQAGFETYSTQVAQESQNAFQLALLDRQMQRQAANTAARVQLGGSGFGSVPTAVMAGSVRNTGAAGSLGSFASSGPMPAPKAGAGPAPYMGPWSDYTTPQEWRRGPFGLAVAIPKGEEGQYWENQFGDEGGAVYGVARALESGVLGGYYRAWEGLKQMKGDAFLGIKKVQETNWGRPYDPTKSVFQ